MDHDELARWIEFELSTQRKFRCTCAPAYPITIVIKENIVIKICQDCERAVYIDPNITANINLSRVDNVADLVRSRDPSILRSTHAFQRVLDKYGIEASKKNRLPFAETVRRNERRLPFTWENLLEMHFQ
jgi:hypothetical protein